MFRRILTDFALAFAALFQAFGWGWKAIIKRPEPQPPPPKVREVVAPLDVVWRYENGRMVPYLRDGKEGQEVRAPQIVSSITAAEFAAAMKNPQACDELVQRLAKEKS